MDLCGVVVHLSRVVESTDLTDLCGVFLCFANRLVACVFICLCIEMSDACCCLCRFPCLHGRFERVC